MAGGPEPYTKQNGQLTSLWGSTRTSRTLCHRVQLLDLGLRWNLLLMQEWTLPTHRAYGVGGLLKNHHTVHRAAGCVCCDCYTYMQQLFIEKPLMENKAKLNAPLFCTYIRWTSRSANGMCSVDSECTHHSSFPKSEASVLFDLTTKSVKNLVVVEPPAIVGLGLCFQPLFMMSFSTLPSLRWN